MLHVRYLSSYATLLCIASLLNAKLEVHGSSRHSTVEDSAFFVNEAIWVAERSLQYRPLGSSSVPLCLIAAYATTDEEQKREKTEALLKAWHKDFEATRWLELADRLRGSMSGQGWTYIWHTN
jgi:hypothetical protein